MWANRLVLAGIAISALSAFCLGGILSLVPAHSQSGDDGFFTHLHTEKAMANVTVLPARVGPVDIAIQLETTDETPLTAQALFVTLTNAKSGIAPQTAVAERTSDDWWLVKMSAPVGGAMDAQSRNYTPRISTESMLNRQLSSNDSRLARMVRMQGALSQSQMQVGQAARGVRR